MLYPLIHHCCIQVDPVSSEYLTALQLLMRFQETFTAWLHILALVPRSIVWLLRFPAAGEEHLMRTAKAWAGDEVASRVRFSDMAQKEEHILRCRVADLFLDTLEVRTGSSEVLGQALIIFISAMRTQWLASE